MRYRNHILEQMYPDYELDGYYILWVDIDVLFPYSFSNANAFLRLNGPEITHSAKSQDFFLIKDINTKVLIKEGDWYHAGVKEGLPGIPFFFESFEQMQRITQAIGYIEFDYINMYKEACKCVVFMSQNFQLQEKEGNKDYEVKLQGTVVPMLLEKAYGEERKEIISKYENVIQANASNNDKVIHSNVIKQTSKDLEWAKEEMVGGLFCLVNKGYRVEQNLYLHMFLNENIFLYPPVTIKSGLNELLRT